MLKEKENTYDLILMDVQMPIMDGLTATEIIREENKTIPIIALTASVLTIDTVKTKKAGMNEHLKKPIEIDKLYETLLRYLHHDKSESALIWNEPIDNIQLPVFKYIDIFQGLNHMDQNKKLYLKILNDFYVKYKDMKFTALSKEEVEIELHTLKGLSLNIGAIKLNEKLIDTNSIISAMEELEKVLFEIEQKVVPIYSNQKAKIKIISNNQVEILWNELYTAIETSRPKVYQPVIDQLNNTLLNSSDVKKLFKINEFLSKFEFEKALNIIKEG